VILFFTIVCPAERVISIRSAEIGFVQSINPNINREQCAQVDPVCELRVEREMCSPDEGQLCTFNQEIFRHIQCDTRELLQRLREQQHGIIRFGYNCVSGKLKSLLL